jgi:hypothetical protein
MIFGKKIREYNKLDKWYAWYPVRLDDSRLVWFEYVERREIPFWDYFYYSYKEIKDTRTNYEKVVDQMATELDIKNIWKMNACTVDSIFKLWYNEQLSGKLIQYNIKSQTEYELVFNDRGLRHVLLIKE